MRLVFLGVPGAGKGTQATRLARQQNIVHISTGDMLRETIKEDSPLARELKDFLGSGQLVPDEKMNEVVRLRLAKPDVSEGFILDGYPRTVAQSEALEKYLSKKNLVLDATVFFNLPHDTAIERLSGRRTCKKCGANFHVKFKPPASEGTCDACGGELYQRDDDKPDVIKKRLQEYDNKTAGLVNFYRDRNLLKEIDASPGPDEVHNRVLKAFGLGVANS